MGLFYWPIDIILKQNTKQYPIAGISLSVECPHRLFLCRCALISSLLLAKELYSPSSHSYNYGCNNSIQDSCIYIDRYQTSGSGLNRPLFFLPSCMYEILLKMRATCWGGQIDNIYKAGAKNWEHHSHEATLLAWHHLYLQFTYVLEKYAILFSHFFWLLVADESSLYSTE